MACLTQAMEKTNSARKSVYKKKNMAHEYHFLTCHCGHNILDLFNISPIFSFHLFNISPIFFPHK